jgi:hypothetical protein
MRTYQRERPLAKLGTARSGCGGYISIFPSWIYFLGYTRLLCLLIQNLQKTNAWFAGSLPLLSPKKRRDGRYEVNDLAG